MDLLTGAAISEKDYRAANPAGKATLRAARYLPQHEPPDEDYPLQFSTGRTVYHFHTRTKTARAPQLNRAAPGMWVEMSPADAERLEIDEGDVLSVRSRRGEIVAPARVSGVREGTVFAPFHYGYWDSGRTSRDGQQTAANELTMTEWDPVSKQPVFKNAAVRVQRLAAGTGPAPAPTTTASRPAPPSGDAHLCRPPSAGRPGRQPKSSIRCPRRRSRPVRSRHEVSGVPGDAAPR